MKPPPGRMPFGPLRIATLLFVVGVGCTAAPAEAPPAEDEAQVQAPVVYGSDDRKDYWQHPDGELRRLTAESTVAMISPDQLIRDGNGWRVVGPSLGRIYELCDDQLFFDQPVASTCSATLIDDDLAITAGHCVFNDSDCRRFSWVFGYHEMGPGEMRRLEDEDVFGCSRVVLRREDFRTPVLDYAIVQLDRPATPRHRPAPIVAAAEILEPGDRVAMIGFPSGIPAKIDSGGMVTRHRPTLGDFFEATVDAFEGNSGSGVYDADYRLVGILSRGATDYRRRRNANCREVNRLSDSPTRSSEGITYAGNAIEALCATGWESDRLCGGSCGDGLCSAGDSATSCGEDCLFDSWVPAEWTCGPETYGSGEACACECGVFDPDCSDPDLPVLGCDAGERCGPAGTCEEEDEVPLTWRCDPALYGSGEACHCSCGAPDPSCDDESLEVRNCPAGYGCTLDGECALEIGDLPEEWTCDPLLWANGRECACECGAWDPDCANLALPIRNCSLSQVCREPGVCFGVDQRDEGGLGDDDCADCSSAGSSGPSPGLLLPLLGLIWLRRRSRRALREGAPGA